MHAGRLVTVVAALALLAPHVAAQSEKCRMEYRGSVVEYPCGSGETAGGAAEEEPWWATNSFQAVLAFVGLVASASAGGYTLYRIRRRRKTLSATLAAIESTYAQAKREPEAGIAKLAAIRAQVREQHEKGRLDDAHFLELDKRATDHLVRLRLLEVDRRFAMLPPLFLAEIRRLLADGALTQSEADLIEVRAAVFRIPDPVRAELAELARRWAGDDAPRALEAEAA